MRLDVYIVGLYPHITRSHAKRLIETGNVKVGGVVSTKPSQKVKDGEDVQLKEPKAEHLATQPEDIPLNILYEDSSIIVVDKPAGMVVHPGAGNFKGTLVNALLGHCRDLSGIGGKLRPGIVHRLDKGTSGVMVVAKNDPAHLSLSNQFKDRSVEKRYCALLYGRVPKEEGAISAPIGRHVSNRKKMSVKCRRGRVAETYYKVIERFGDELTFVDVRLATGRTHQIRVHFSHMGHPLVGDGLYGGAKTIKRLKNSKLVDIIKSFSRPALHAYKLCFVHPVSNKKLVFTAPMPEDMGGLLKKLERRSV